jgi:hypothetical protein
VLHELKSAQEGAVLGPRSVSELWPVPRGRVHNNCAQRVHRPARCRFTTNSSEASGALCCVVLLRSPKLEAQQLLRKRDAPVRPSNPDQYGMQRLSDC